MNRSISYCPKCKIVGGQNYCYYCSNQSISIEDITGVKCVCRDDYGFFYGALGGHDENILPARFGKGEPTLITRI